MTIFNISYKYRLYPNNPQAQQIAINFECCRKIYNLMLQEKIREYERTHQVPIVYPEMYFEKTKIYYWEIKKPIHLNNTI